MNKTKIEWCDYTINPVKGLCPMACPYCYARAMYKRFGWDEQLSFHPEVFDTIEKIKNPSRIFVGSTMELFGNWIPDTVLHSIFNYVEHYPQHTFIFLTKQPQNLIKWSPFPDNCWVGCSSTGQLNMTAEAFAGLANIEAKVKFISFEPLLYEYLLSDYLDVVGINWVIIGQQTPVKVSTMPQARWITEIIESCDKLGISMFLKYNLAKGVMCPTETDQLNYQYAAYKDGILRQEFPETRSGLEVFGEVIETIKSLVNEEVH